ncbi:uncharacterized protein BDW47DRAFT_111370 [Aspergillus candidus]|uniref:Uncharacterized protein n=1 Tax=Aspergillus candidus TaxID=41067 RepID=A0A2I2F2K2_ASPCN|nr:hypothetical protein BDW47DRAFT_111370 [Aspergillus candidus]PLB34850.1 hypothetical protein BDW47DRAFT_111370 [Aspergillus candidus]
MQLTKTLLTVMAAAFLVAAAPASTSGEQALQARGCPNNWNVCGTCNGGDCKIALTNHKCDIGKCTKQSGGGDGKLCGAVDVDTPLKCPGRG